MYTWVFSHLLFVLNVSYGGVVFFFLLKMPFERANIGVECIWPSIFT